MLSKHTTLKTNVNCHEYSDLTLNVLSYCDNDNDSDNDSDKINPKFVEYIEFLRKEIICDDKLFLYPVFIH